MRCSWAAATAGMLAHGAKLGEQWGYDEINLNCGCPSERVQTGSFGACLMAEPALVADCVKAMRDAVALPVTVKHRIGLDDDEDYGFVRDFVGTVAAAGCDVFIVHARNAVLKGLSPKENREVPPLRYDVVHRLKRDFPALTIVLNGGITTGMQSSANLHRRRRDARARRVPRSLFPGACGLAPVAATRSAPPRADVLRALMPYAAAQRDRGVPLRAIARHVLGSITADRAAGDSGRSFRIRRS